MEFAGKNVLITGANRGIGLATAQAFLEEGAFVIGFVRRKESFPAELCQKWEAQQKLLLIECDMEKEGDIAKACTQVKKEVKQVDVLINNAGILKTSNFLMMSMKDLRQTFEVNFFAMCEVTQRISRCMIKNGGVIINISSLMAHTYEAGTAAYSASKAAVLSWTKILAKELGDYHIRVNAICPGPVETDMIRLNSSEEAVKNIVEQHQIVKRLGKPQEIAAALLFIASDRASYITGASINVDGGTYY